MDLKKVLEKIKPDKEEKERVNKIINNFLGKLNSKLKKIKAKAILGGSGAKDTWLSGAHDADIFVEFDYSKYTDKSNELSDILEKVLKKIFPKVDRLHGSRDYFQIKAKDARKSEMLEQSSAPRKVVSGNTSHVFVFEIVPILKISKANQALNITDISPLHAKWVNKYPKLNDEIRLVKQFCKACGVYGAESYIQGFSGYIVEILTIKYGGFNRLVREASKWGNKIIIDVSRHYRDKNQVMMNINKSKLISPLVLVDPVDKDRNAAAAVNSEMYFRFINCCKNYLKKPSEEFFEVKKINVFDLKKDKKKNEELVVLEAISLKGKEDVIGSKLVKVFDFISNKALSYGFKILRKDWQWNNKVLVWFYFDKKKLDSFEIREGPMASNKFHAARFKKKYGKRVFVGKGRLYAKVKRKFCDFRNFVKDLIKDEYVKERVKEVKVL